MKNLIIIFAFTFSAFAEKPSYLPSDLTESQKIIAMTILGEARGEGEAGMYAVACVIAQRCIAWNKKPKNVCLKPEAFSCWNNRGDLAITKMLNLLETKEGEYAKRLAVNLYNLDRTFVKNADHFCTLPKKPYWTFKTIKRNKKKIKVPIKPVATIGNHKFFKLR